jgi:hypothetical protein
VFLFEQFLELPLFLKMNLFHYIKNIALTNVVIIQLPVNPTTPAKENANKTVIFRWYTGWWIQT